MRPLVMIAARASRFRDALADCLDAADFAVMVVDSVPAALEALEAEVVAALVAEVELKHRSGIWLLEWSKVLRPTTFTALLCAEAHSAEAVEKVDLILRTPLPPMAIVSRLRVVRPTRRASANADTRPLPAQGAAHRVRDTREVPPVEFPTGTD